MFKTYILAVILALTPALLWSQSTERSITLEVNATVANVVAETRTVVLTNDDSGATEFIKAGPDVLNFDQIAVGDSVKAVYTLGIAARMALPGEVDTIAELDAAAAEGEKPAALSGTAVTVVLEFQSFDAAASVARVKTSGGVEEQIGVATETGREFAAGLTAGDKVALTFTEGVAVGIVQD